MARVPAAEVTIRFWSWKSDVRPDADVGWSVGEFPEGEASPYFGWLLRRAEEVCRAEAANQDAIAKELG